MPGPFTDLLARGKPVILDGGLATTLEARGHDLDDPLWSARLLLEDPDAIARVHREFLAAGADVIITASYQASLAGFGVRGLSEAEGERLLRLSVDLAVCERDTFWSDPANRRGRAYPLVAASVGPYGAYLADGSEYRGRYGLTDADLLAFHEPRWRVLADSPADLLACETIPSRREARILLRLIAATTGREAWLTFSCADGGRLCDGSLLADVLRGCDRVEGLAAVGVNCTAPGHVAALLAEARRTTRKPLLVYPNSGERYDPVNKVWLREPGAENWDTLVPAWYRLGAVAIGGCCRVGPERIARIRRRLYQPSS